LKLSTMSTFTVKQAILSLFALERREESPDTIEQYSG
jgi:hypothetical protein